MEMDQKLPQFPYPELPFTHIYPHSGRPHIIERGHDCWCEPNLHHIKSPQTKKTVAILVIHDSPETSQHELSP